MTKQLEQTPEETKVKEPQKIGNGSRLWKILRFFLLGLLSLLLVIAIAITAAVIYLRTDSGQNLLVQEINKALVEPLKAQGLTGSVTSLEGNLPFEIKTGLKLADGRGEFLEAKQVHFDLGFNFWPMGVEIQHLVITNPTLLRIPNLPKTEEPTVEEPKEPLTAKALQELIANLSQQVWDLPDWLPYVHLDDIGIRAASLGQELAGFPLTVTCILGADFRAKKEAKPAQIAFSLKELIVRGDDVDVDFKVSWGSGQSKTDILTGNLDVKLQAWVNVDAFLPKSSKSSGSSQVSDEPLTKKHESKVSPATLNKTTTGINQAQANSDLETPASKIQEQTAGHDHQKIKSDAKSSARDQKIHPQDKPRANPELKTQKLPAIEGVDAKGSDAKEALPAARSVESKGKSKGESIGELKGESKDRSKVELSGKSSGELNGESQNRLAGNNKPWAAKGKGLRLVLHLTGPTLEPKLDLSLDLDHLAQAGQNIDNTSLKISAHPLNLQGFLGLKTGVEELGLNLKLATKLNGQAVKLDLPIYSQMESDDYKVLKAGVRKMALDGLGLNVAATIEALVGKTDLPLINGELLAKITDWAYISAFVPEQNFAGQLEAQVNLKADKLAQSSQKANVKLNIPSFVMHPHGKPALVALEGFALHSSVDDVFNVPKIVADLAAKRVVAGPINIATQANVKGSIDGQINLVLSTKGNVDTDVALELQKNRLHISKLQVLADSSLLNLQAQNKASNDKISVNQSAAKRGRSAKNAKTNGARKNGPSAGSKVATIRNNSTGAKSKGASLATSPIRSGSKIGLRLLSPTDVLFGDNGVSIKNTKVALLPTGSLTARGDLLPDRFDLNCAIDSFDLGQWKSLISDLPEGKIDFKLALGGSPKSPHGGFNLKVASLKVDKAPIDPLDLGVSGQLTAKSAMAVKLDLPSATLTKIGLEQLNFKASIPLTFAANGVPNVNLKGALDATIDIRGKLARLWQMVPVADLRLLGDLDGKVRVSGTLEAIKIGGNIKVAQGKFEDPVNGVLLRDLGLNVDLDGSVAGEKLSGGVKIASQIGDGMGGTLTIKGQTPLDASALDIAVKINKLKPLRRNDVRISLSGDVKVAGSATDPRISGTIVVDDGAVQLENVQGGAASVTTLPIKTADQLKAEEEAAKVQANKNQPSNGKNNINLAIKSPGRFLIDGYGLTSAWQTDLKIAGPLTAPLISGEVSCVKGNLDFLNKNFIMEKGIVTLAGGDVANPLLDMFLTNTTNDFTSHIRITGTVKKLKLTLSSEPEMPQDDVLAHILFGRNANELGRYEALQLAAAVAKMGAGLGSGLNNPRQVLGVDVMRVKSGGEKDSSDNSGVSGMALETGKYINDSLYVGIEQGAKEGSTAGIIQLEITPKIKLEMRSQQNNTSGSLNWRYKY